MSSDDVQNTIDALEVMRSDVQDHIVNMKTERFLQVLTALELVDANFSVAIDLLESKRDELLDEEVKEDEE